MSDTLALHHVIYIIGQQIIVKHTHHGERGCAVYLKGIIGDSRYRHGELKIVDEEGLKELKKKKNS